MQWTHPDTVGDLPPPCRTQTATLYYDRKLRVFGGSRDSIYYDDVYFVPLFNPVIVQPLDELILLSITKENFGYSVAMFCLHLMMFGHWT